MDEKKELIDKVFKAYADSGEKGLSAHTHKDLRLRMQKMSIPELKKFTTLVATEARKHITNKKKLAKLHSTKIKTRPTPKLRRSLVK